MLIDWSRQTKPDPATSSPGHTARRDMRSPLYPLNSTQYDLNLEVAESPCAMPLPDAATLVVLPENWTPSRSSRRTSLPPRSLRTVRP